MNKFKTFPAALGAAALALAGNASAAIDTTAITTEITAAAAAAVVVAIAFGVAVWSVRSTKLVRRA